MVSDLLGVTRGQEPSRGTSPRPADSRRQQGAATFGSSGSTAHIMVRLVDVPLEGKGEPLHARLKHLAEAGQDARGELRAHSKGQRALQGDLLQGGG